MSKLLNVTRNIAVVITIILVTTSIRMAGAQEITPSDIEKQVRASLSVWDTADPSRIMEVPGPIGNYGAFGFGYRTKASRAMSIEEEKELIGRFLASVEYYRIIEDEIHTTVDGNLGWLGAFLLKSFT